MKRIRILGRKKPTQMSEIIDTIGNVANIIETVASPIMEAISDDYQNTPQTQTEIIPSTPSQSPSQSPSEEQILNVLDINVKKTQSETSSNCSKETINNEDVLDFFDKKEDDHFEIECKKLSNNELFAKETARFKISLDTQNDIIGFMYSIQSKMNFIHTSHVESIDKNVVSIIMNNLSNKKVSFDISYAAFL